MAANQQQDPSSVRFNLSLLTSSSGCVCVRPFHGNWLDRFRNSLFQKGHLVPLEGPEAPRLSVCGNCFHRDRRRPLYYLTDKVLASNPYNIGIPMILLGLVLIGTGFYIRYSRTKPKLLAGLGEMKLKNYVIIGIAQGITALPGVSRSGMTVSTMLLMGVKPEQAFRLSYLAYIPASFGAFFVTLLLSKSQVDTAIQIVEPTGVLIAIVSAAVIGIFVISYLLKFAKTSRIYVIDFVLGSVALIVGIIATLLAPQTTLT